MRIWIGKRSLAIALGGVLLSVTGAAVAFGQAKSTPPDSAALGPVSALRSSSGKLTAAEAACLAAWSGPTSDLSLRFGREMLKSGRRADAAAEALALLASDPAGRSAKDAAKLAKEAGQKTEVPGGVHQSIFRVALLVPQTGDYATYGRSLTAGVEFAIFEHNRLSRLPIRLVTYDTAGEPWRASARGRQALEEGSGAFIGEVLSAPTLVLAGVTHARGVPLLSPSATEESIGEAGAAVFQSGLSQVDQGRALARYAVHELHLKRIALSDSASLLGAGFASEARDLGAFVVGVPSPGGKRDDRTAVNLLRRAEADGLVLPADPDAAELWLTAVAREEYRVKFLGTEALDPQNLHPEARRAAEGMALVGLDYALPDSIFLRVDEYAEARFGVHADRLVRHGYLAGHLLAGAIAAGAASPPMLSEALSRRVAPRSVGPPPRGFIAYSESEAVVPIFAVRRGSTVRVR